MEGKRPSAKPFPNLVDGLARLPQKQWDDHYALYKNYVRKLSEVMDGLASVDTKTVRSSDAAFSEYAELRRRESFLVNAILLHELYFENIGRDRLRIHELPVPGTVREAIRNVFGSEETWFSEMVASTRIAHGWSVLAWNHRSRELTSFVMNSHSDGGVVGLCPIVVVDSYEHAWWGHLSKDQYAEEIVLESLDWSVIEERYQQAIQRR